MGTEVRCLLAAHDEQLAFTAITEVERLERCWSRFRDDSELCALNASEDDLVEVSPTLAGALHRAVLAWRSLDGWFDPTVLSTLEAAGYLHSHRDGGARRGALGACRPCPSPAAVQVDLDRCTVRRPPGVRFDLGGLGKGLAADMVSMLLVEQGATSVCLSVGGDVRVAGNPPAGGWVIPVERPPDRERCVASPWFDAVLTEGSIVCSTTRLRRWTTVDGEPAHHLIDPGTGRPAESPLASVVVAASEAWWAEALAKAALVAGPRLGRELLAQHGATGWLDGPGPDRPLTQVG